MSLLTLPAEIRNHIYTYLPELKPTVPKTISHYKPPPICRVSSLTRQDTFATYIGHCLFRIYLYPDSISRARLERWLATLGAEGIKNVRYIRFTQSWPGCGGFELAVLKNKDVGSCCWTETYDSPAQDVGHVARETSTKVLQHVVTTRLVPKMIDKPEEDAGLTADDIAFFVQAMAIVAAHSFTTHTTLMDSHQCEAHSAAWHTIKHQLLEMMADGNDAPGKEWNDPDFT